MLIMNVKRVTLRDIAQASGVHFATVSRALRGDPQVGAETTRNVRLKAEEMGYRPDPMLTALSAYRAQIKKPEYRATIAWVVNDFKRRVWSEYVVFKQYFQGARERAAQLGYRLEEFWLREPGITPKRASSILHSRGVSGLILVPQPRPKMRVRLEWEYFSAVALGYTTARPQLNMVANHHFHSMMTAVRRIRTLGYRRIGLALDRRHDTRSDHSWTGAFLSQQQFWPVENWIPVLSVTGIGSNQIHEWLKTYRPDAVISYPALAGQLEALGYRIPQDLGFAAYGRNDEGVHRSVAGIDENATLTGYAAMDLLAGMIQRGERGVPKVRQCLLVEGSWHEGETLRPQNRREVLPGEG